MSDHSSVRRPGADHAARDHAARDRGMTLPEMLIAIVVIGLVATVLTAGVSVTLRQSTATRGRVDVARWEQNLGTWLPDDLSSASEVDGDPGRSPCGASSCDGIDLSSGSNVLLLSWTDGGATTTVSYRYQPDTNGEYGLFRVACTSGSCSSLRILGDLGAPPATWAPGQAAPSEVVEVDYPLASDPTDTDGLDDSAGKRRVIVTVNGTPAADGTDRSSRVSLAAGGASLGTLEPAVFSGPSFVQARSDCGGPITLVVDSSGSIGGDMGAVRDGVKEFVNLFDGTPTQLQIVEFDTVSRSLGSSGAWNMYFDMSEPGSAATLNGLVDGVSAGGSTNWEDALFRTFYTSSGVPHDQAGNPSAPMPEMVVFFTDGMPTRDRRQSKSDSASTAPNDPDGTKFDSSASYSRPLSDLSPRAWYRAEDVADDFRSEVRIIGLGVGTEFGASRFVRSTTATNGPIIPGWPTVALPHAKFLGNLVEGGDPSDPVDNPYITNTWSAGSGWGDLSTADVLVASDFNRFADALAQIALAECGGTLTVQTRVAADQSQAQFDLTYEADGEAVTTSRIAKSGTFDIALAGLSQRTVRLTPQADQLATAGFTATGWLCRARGVDLVEGVGYDLVSPGDPAMGIDVTVRANGALSCTLQVAS